MGRMIIVMYLISVCKFPFVVLCSEYAPCLVYSDMWHVPWHDRCFLLVDSGMYNSIDLTGRLTWRMPHVETESNFYVEDLYHCIYLFVVFVRIFCLVIRYSFHWLETSTDTLIFAETYIFLILFCLYNKNIVNITICHL